MQPNVERKPIEEMLAAEATGKFSYNVGPGTSTAEPERIEQSNEALLNRLQNLEIIGKTSLSKSTVSEKITKTSSSRTLTVDDDDLDLDLELDDTIDTTVSKFHRSS